MSEVGVEGRGLRQQWRWNLRAQLWLLGGWWWFGVNMLAAMGFPEPSKSKERTVLREV